MLSMSSLPARYSPERRRRHALVTAGVLLLAILCFVGVRYRQHQDRVATISRDVAALDARLARDREVERALVDIAQNRYNRASTQFSDAFDDMASPGDFAVLDSKIVRLKRVMRALDGVIARLQHLNPQNTRDRDLIGDFEAYWRSSDQFTDALTALQGMVKTAENNPFALLGFSTGQGRALGFRVGHSARQYTHMVQYFVYSMQYGIANLTKARDGAERRLSSERSKNIIAWTASP